MRGEALVLFVISQRGVKKSLEPTKETKDRFTLSFWGSLLTGEKHVVKKNLGKSHG